MKKEKANNFLKNMNFMFHHSWQLARNTYFFMIIQSVINTVQPFALLIMPKYILDELAGQRRPDVTLKYIALYAGVIVFFSVISRVLDRCRNMKLLKCSHDIDMYYQKQWLYMDYENLENGKVRELADRCIDQLNPDRFAEETVLGFISNAVQLAGYTYIVASLHPVIIAIILAVIGINAYIARKLNKTGYEYEPLLTHFSRRYSYIFDMMLGIRGGNELRINGASKWLIKKFDNETSRYLSIFNEKQNKNLKYDVLSMVVGFVQTVVIYGYCAYLAISGGITIGSFSVFLGAVTAFTGSFTGLIKRFPNLTLLSKYVDDYREFLQYTKHKGEERETISGDEPTNGKYDIEFENVSFMYPNTDRYVLKDINIKIKAGERLSVVGYNGAGKSTFIKLLCKLYEPTKGRILVGGVDIATIKPEDYRKLLAVVFQDYQLLWLSSIRENIVLNNRYDEERFIDAVEKSGLNNRISLLKKGFDTILDNIYDEETVRFSGGEEQKLACARAYYKEARIVILDEPTASLDPIAETNLYERFNSIIGEKTSIYISHRLASVKFCDSVAVFADGRLVERGTHCELMEKDGIYADMFKKQAYYYVKKDTEEADAS